MKQNANCNLRCSFNFLLPLVCIEVVQIRLLKPKIYFHKCIADEKNKLTMMINWHICLNIFCQFDKKKKHRSWFVYHFSMNLKHDDDHSFEDANRFYYLFRFIIILYYKPWHKRKLSYFFSVLKFLLMVGNVYSLTAS